VTSTLFKRPSPYSTTFSCGERLVGSEEAPLCFANRLQQRSVVGHRVTPNKSLACGSTNPPVDVAYRSQQCVVNSVIILRRIDKGCRSHHPDGRIRTLQRLQRRITNLLIHRIQVPPVSLSASMPNALRGYGHCFCTQSLYKPLLGRRGG
jgi:hypothetical protein